MAYVAELFGVADITGAFVAGLAISSEKDVKYISNRFETLSYMFLSPVFFASIGLTMNGINMNGKMVLFTVLLLAVAIITKIIGCGLGAKVCKYTNQESLQIAMGMISRGEVALIVAAKGQKLGLMGDEVFAPIIIMVVATTIITPVFLRKYGLDKDFKMNIEANHATLAQHTFQHELRVARDNGVFGSIDANQGDPLLGWDTDQFPTNAYDATLCMYEVLKAGGFTNGGLNFDAKARRGSYTMEDIFLSYIAGMDTFALGLKAAAKIIEDGRLDKFVDDRYASWTTGIGADIIAGKADKESLEKYAVEKGEVTDSLSSGRQEYLESVLNQIMFNL